MVQQECQFKKAAGVGLDWVGLEEGDILTFGKIAFRLQHSAGTPGEAKRSTERRPQSAREQCVCVLLFCSHVGDRVWIAMACLQVPVQGEGSTAIFQPSPCRVAAS